MFDDGSADNAVSKFIGQAAENDIYAVVRQGEAGIRVVHVAHMKIKISPLDARAKPVFELKCRWHIPIIDDSVK